MKLWLIIVLLCFPLIAQDRIYNWSVAAVGTSQVFDIHSSIGRYELNPILGRGHFGTRQITIKLTLVSSVMLVQRFILKKHPKHKKAVAFMNFTMAGATTGVAVHNWRAQ